MVASVAAESYLRNQLKNNEICMKLKKSLTGSRSLGFEWKLLLHQVALRNRSASELLLKTASINVKNFSVYLKVKDN
jgi:hypothetical protein